VSGVLTEERVLGRTSDEGAILTEKRVLDRASDKRDGSAGERG
jgi:hypothetical protein